MSTMNGSNSESHWNPAGPDGKTRICLTCESKMHLDPDCPFNNKERNRKRNGEVAKCGTCFSEWHTIYQCPRKKLFKNLPIERCQNCDSIFHSKQKCPHADQQDKVYRNEVDSFPHSHQEDKDDRNEVENFPHAHQEDKEDGNKVENVMKLKCLICTQLAQYAVLTPCCSSLACRACAIGNILKFQGRCGLGTCKASYVQLSSLVPHKEVRKEVEEIEVWKIVEQKEPFAMNKYLFSERNKINPEGKKLYKPLATTSFWYAGQNGYKRTLDRTSEENEIELKRRKLNKSSHQPHYSGLNLSKEVKTPLGNTKVQTNHIDATKKTDSEVTQCTEAEVGVNSSCESTEDCEVNENTLRDKVEKATYDKSMLESETQDETTGASCNSKAADFKKPSVVEKFFIPFSEAPSHSASSSFVLEKSSDEGVPCPAKSCVPQVERAPEITRVSSIFDGVKAQYVFGGSFGGCFHKDFLSSDHISTCLGVASNFPVNSQNTADQQKSITSNVSFTNISAGKVFFAEPVIVCDNNLNVSNTEVSFHFESPVVVASEDNFTNIRSDRISFAKPVDVSGSNSIWNNTSRVLNNTNATFDFESPILQDNSANLFQSADKNTSFNSESNAYSEVNENTLIDKVEKATYDKSMQVSETQDETTGASCNSKVADFKKPTVVEKFFIPFAEAPLHSALHSIESHESEIGVTNNNSDNLGLPHSSNVSKADLNKILEDESKIPQMDDQGQKNCNCLCTGFKMHYLCDNCPKYRVVKVGNSTITSSMCGILAKIEGIPKDTKTVQLLFTSEKCYEDVYFNLNIAWYVLEGMYVYIEAKLKHNGAMTELILDDGIEIAKCKVRNLESNGKTRTQPMFLILSEADNDYVRTLIAEAETLSKISHLNQSHPEGKKMLSQDAEKATINDLSQQSVHALTQPTDIAVPSSVPIDTSTHPFFQDLIISLIEAVPEISERNDSRKIFELSDEEKMDVSESISDNCVCLEDRDNMCLSCPSFKIVLVEDTKLLPDPRSVEEKITLLVRIISADDSEPVSSYIKLFPTVISEGSIPFPGSFFAVPGNENFQMIAGIRKVIMGSFTHVTLVRPKMFDAKYFEAKSGQVVAIGQKVPMSVNQELDQLEELKIDFGVKEVYLKSTKDASVFLPGKPKYSTVVIPELKASSHLLVNLKISGKCNKLVSRSSKYTLQDNNEILIPLKNVGEIAMEIETNSQIATATSFFTTDNFKSSIELIKRSTQEKKEMPAEEANKNEDGKSISETDAKSMPDDCRTFSETDAGEISIENRIQSAEAASKWRVIFVECEKIFDGEHAQFTQIGCYAYTVKNRGKATFFSPMFPTKNDNYLQMKQKSDLLKTLHLILEKESGFQFIQPDGEKVKASSESEGLEEFVTFLGATVEGEDNVLFLNSADCFLPLLFNKIDPTHIEKYVAGICELKSYVNESLGDDNHLSDLSHIDDLYQRVMGMAWKEITPTCAQTAKYTFQLVENLHFEQGYRNLDHESFVSKYFKPTSHFIEKFANLGTNRKINSSGEEISLEIESSFRPGFPATVEMCKIELVDLTGLSDEETTQDLDNALKKDALQHLSSSKNGGKPSHDSKVSREGIPTTLGTRKIDLIDLTDLDLKNKHSYYYYDDTPEDLQRKDAPQDPHNPDTKESLEQLDLGSKVSYRVLTVGTYELEAVRGKMMTILVEFEGIPPGIEVISFDKNKYFREKGSCREYGTRIPIFEGKKENTASPVVEGKYGFVDICLTRKKVNLVIQLKQGKVKIPSGTHILNCQPVYIRKSPPMSYETNLEKFMKSNLNNLQAIATCVDENMSALIRPVEVPSTEPQLTLPVPVPARKSVRNGAEIPPSSPTDGKKLTEQSSTCQIPPNFKCPFCSNLLADAVILPCCWMPSCDACAREMLNIDGFRCRLCTKGNVWLHQLIPSHRLRENVSKFRDGQLTGGISSTEASTGSLLTTNATPSGAKSQTVKLSVTDPVCRFFATSRGCARGNTCIYKHEQNAKKIT